MKQWPASTHSTHIDYTKQADQLHTLFSRLHPQDVEDFYHSYQHWILQEHIQSLQGQIAIIQQSITENGRQMKALQPSPIAHATLARLRIHGVEDIDVLDRLLEHDDSWLNHTLELLEQCEHLGFIQENYTQWCEYALEGAYDWITSIDVNNQDTQDTHDDQYTSEIHDSLTVAAKPGPQESDMLPQVTEEELLQKLMSEEDEETVKRPSVPASAIATRISDHANALETLHDDVPANSAASPVISPGRQPVATTRPLPVITQPLPIVEEERLVESASLKRTEAVSTFTSTLPSSSAVATPQRGPLWRFFNMLARFFFAT